MVHFLDGPAAGQTLWLKRSPIMLRVVQSAGGTWDALDQPTDQPRPRERIYVYRMAEHRGTAHVSRRPRSQSGWYAMADYRLYAEQPPPAAARDTPQWRAWCVEMQAKERRIHPVEGGHYANRGPAPGYGEAAPPANDSA